MITLAALLLVLTVFASTSIPAVAAPTPPVVLQYGAQTRSNYVQTFQYHMLHPENSVLNANENLELLADQDEIKAELEGDLLNYPNPFNSREGTEIGYRLSKDMTVELKVYNILGHEVLCKKFEAGNLGGQAGYNLVPITFHENLASSTYFYILMHNDKILGKSTMGVRP